jgi:V8-like Glu-specific endopeptidase
LVGCGGDHNLEVVGDLKTAAGTARIQQIYDGNLSGHWNHSQNQSEQHPHSAPIRVHSNSVLEKWTKTEPRPAGSAATNV